MIGSIIETAAAQGRRVRCFGEMVGLLWDQGNIEGALELESMWNDLAEHHDFALFCGYAMSALEASGAHEAAARMPGAARTSAPGGPEGLPPPADAAPGIERPREP